MRKITFFCLGLLVLFFGTFGCNTKRIVLVTNVELDFTQQNTPEGFVQDLLPTTLTITPEAFLEEFVYTFSYEVLEGDGVFLDPEEKVLPTGEAIVLERASDSDTNFILNLNYQAQSAGVHQVRVTAADNFEKSFSEILTYTISDIPVVWELTSPVATADQQQEIPLTLTLAQKTEDPDITYQVRYRFTEGSGQLLDALAAPITLDRLLPITTGSQELTLISDQIGTTSLQAELIDSNGQRIATSADFTILEVDRTPPVITFIGSNPLIVLTGTTYTDPGVQITDNRDTEESLQEKLVIDSSQVNTSVPGDYEVTYQVSDRTGNQSELVVRTVRVEINMTDVPFFTVKGTSTDKEAFETTLELGTSFSLGSIENLTDNGTIVDQGIEDTSGIDGTVPKVGSYTVRYFATDNDDNTTAIVETVVVADTTPPTFTINGKSENFTTPWAAGIQYNARAFQSIIDASTTDGGKVADPNGVVGTPLKTGTYTVTYTVTDAVGLATAISETLQVTDGQAPSFVVNNPNSKPTPTEETTDFTTNLEFGAIYELGVIQNIQDNSGVANTIQDIEDSEGIAGTIPAIRVAPYVVIYSVTDKDTNQKIITEKVVVSDTTKPTFSVDQKGKRNTTNFTTEVKFGGSYSVGTIKDAKDLSGTTQRITGQAAVNTNIEGSYQVTYTVTDQSPKANQTTIVETVKVGPDNRAPIARIKVTPGINGIAPYKITLDGTSSSDPDAGDSIAAYRWFLPGGVENTNATVIQTLAEGTYEIKLAVTDQNGATDEETQTITVKANQPPTFDLSGGLPYTTRVEIGGRYTPRTIQNIQDDKTISDTGTIGGQAVPNPTNVLQKYEVTYSVTDSDGATTTLKEIVNVEDKTPPVITLKGANPLTITQGSTYNELGATVADNNPGTTKDPIINSSAVKTGTIGTYQVTYNVTDPSGNKAVQKTRSVKVVKRPLSVNLTANKTVADAPATFTFSTRVSNNSGTVIYSWSIPGSGSTNSRRYTTAGIKKVTVTVRAGGETADDTVTVRVIELPDDCNPEDKNNCIDSGQIWCPDSCRCANAIGGVSGCN